ncbi:MAG: Rha family transcriptional regulator [Pseudomonadota bacterium]
MTTALQLTSAKGESRIDSRIVAEHLQNQHRPVMALIDKYIDRFERFGKVLFQKAPSSDSRTGQQERFALLNEDQSYFLLSLARNTDHVVDLKANLVSAFGEARKAIGAEAEYLPSYHALHDRLHALAANSANEKFVHMNVNKLINKTIGVQSGERHGLPVPRKSLLIVAQAAATQAMESANDHHDGYAMVKQAMANIQPIAQQLAGAAPSRIA